MRLGVKIGIAFTLGLLIIGVVGIRAYIGVQNVAEINRWVSHTHEVLENLEHILSELKDAETGQRGFVLTGEDRYLDPYNAAAGEIQKDIATLASLTADNPDQQANLQQLTSLSRDKLAELQETIQLRKQADQAAALQVIRSDRGRRIMDEIRLLVTQMETHERELLTARNRTAADVTRQSAWTVGIGMLLSLLVLAVSAVVITRSLRLADHRPLSAEARRNWLALALRYAFAVAMVGLATLVRSWLEKSFGPMPMFITWYPAVLLVASIAGGGPGILATILAALAADYWFIQPKGEFGIEKAGDAIGMGIFVGTSLLLSVLAERLRRARWVEAVNVTQEKQLGLLDMGNLLILDMDHHIVRWSRGCRRLYGYEAQEAKGQFTYELLKTTFSRPLEEIHRILLMYGHWEGEATRRTRNGTELSVAILWALRRDEKGDPLDILEVSTDITPQKRAEDLLRQQSEELAQQNEELTQQSEELSQQAEEMSAQNEELQAQSTEIQSLNIDLGRREKMLQTLLDSARLSIGEKEVVAKICRAAIEMIGVGAAVVFERQGDVLRVLAHAGLEGEEVPHSMLAKGTFCEMVMRQNRTASLEDTSLRPDFSLLQIPGQQRFAAVLSSPVQLAGKPVGVVSIFARRPQQWTTEQFRLIEWLAGKCSNTLEALRLAEEVRNVSEQRRLTLEAADMGLWDYRFDTGEVYWDQRCRDMWGITQGDQIDYSAAIDRIDPEDRSGVDEAVKQSLAGTNGGAYHREFRVVWPDGSVHWIASHGRAYFEGEGPARRAVRFVGANREITFEKKASEALRKNEATLRGILNASKESIWMFSPQGVILMGNETAFSRFGKPASQIVGKHFTEIMPSELAQSRLANLRDVVASVRPLVSEDERAGINFLHSFYPVTDSGGRVVAVACYSRDITERKRAEELLRQSEKQYRELVQNANSVIIRWTPDGKLTFFNKFAQCFFGYSEAEALGRSVTMLIPDQDSLGQDLSHLAQDIVENPQAYANNENENICRDGQRVWVQWTNRAVLDATGKVVEILAIGNDITARKRGEKEIQRLLIAVQEEKDRLTSLIHSISDEVWFADINKKFTLANPAAVKEFRLGAADAVDVEMLAENLEVYRSDGSLRPVEEAPPLRALAGEVIQAADEIIRTPGSGELRHRQVSAAPVRDATGKIIGSVSVVRDVTESKRLELERQITAEFLHLVNASAGKQELIQAAATFFQKQSGCEAVGIRLKEDDDYPYFEARGFSNEFVQMESHLCEYDAAGNIQRDEQGDPLMACMCGNVICRRFDPAYPFFTSAGSFWTNCTTQLLATTSDTDRQARTRNRCNGEGYESVALIPLHAGSERLGLLQLNDRREGRFSIATISLWERLAGYLSVALSKFIADENLRTTVNELERSNKELEQFAYVASHDLQEPLRQVMAFVQLLRERHLGSLDGKAAQYMQFVVDGTSRMSDLVRDLLAYSRVEARDIPLEPVSSRKALEAALANLQASIQESHASITYNVDELPIIAFKPTQLTQLFQNLVGNAVKFHVDGEAPEVNIGARRNGTHWLFWVKDNGIGIDPAYKEKVFNIFQRLHGREKYQGTGIGLAICKKIVEQHGGKIWVESKPGEGATFYFSMPEGDIA